MVDRQPTRARLKKAPGLGYFCSRCGKPFHSIRDGESHISNQACAPEGGPADDITPDDVDYSDGEHHSRLCSTYKSRDLDAG